MNDENYRRDRGLCYTDIVPVCIYDMAELLVHMNSRSWVRISDVRGKIIALLKNVTTPDNSLTVHIDTPDNGVVVRTVRIK